MAVRLDYGRHGRIVALPDHGRVSLLDPPKGQPLADPAAAIAAALAAPIATPPLHQLAQRRRDAVIVISDKTRPIPYATVLPPILAALDSAGLPRRQIEIVVATGLHRANTGAELIEMVGAEIAGSYRIRNHVARDTAAHTHIGTTEMGTEIWIDGAFLRADLKIVT
ncbi:MAG TPA: lactate racemase domain-containing protein, partial [Terriglobales bacterium]|nr:lactate racemase domain-containing protein [Terriglobales bacterium]